MRSQERRLYTESLFNGGEVITTHNLFISHSWTYAGQYDQLMELLRGRAYFRFKDYSEPRDDPIHNAGTAAGLRQAIRTQMAPCGVVLILAGVYGEEAPIRHFLFSIGAIGALLSVSWCILIRSYRQLNSGKFKALHELEKKLAYPFFTRERELLGEGEKISRYWRLTVVETSLPLIFLALFSSIIVYSFFY